MNVNPLILSTAKTYMVVSNLLDTISESALKSLLPRLIVVQIFLGEDKNTF